MDRGVRLIVAIDGPSGAGKGTVARAMARALGYTHVDTGAMYRAVALEGGAATGRSTTTATPPRIARDSTLDVRTARCASTATTSRTRFARRRSTRRRPPSPACRTCAAALVERQRAMGATRRRGDGRPRHRHRGVPDADVKVYLDASPEERARRRAADPAHGGGADVAHVAQGMAARDKSDSTRSVAPLVRAADAVYIDTTGMSIESVVAQVIGLVRAKAGG